MKIAVIGCGAVGSFYGAKLARASHEVHFLLRSDYEVVKERGVHIRSWQGDFHARPLCAARPEEIGPADLVLIGLKTTANAQLQQLVGPVMGPATIVMTLQNGLGAEEHLARFADPANIMAGLCSVCLNRLEPGLIHHIDHGLVVVGQFAREPDERTRRIYEMFLEARMHTQLTDNLARSRWEKLTWNVPFNGLGVAASAGLTAVATGQVDPGRPISGCLTTDKLLADQAWEDLVRELMQEVVRAAEALGFHIPVEIVKKQMERTRSMGAYKASTIIDFERGLPMELEAVFLEPLRRARAAGAQVPKWENLCRVLQWLDPGNQGPRIDAH